MAAIRKSERNRASRRVGPLYLPGSHAQRESRSYQPALCVWLYAELQQCRTVALANGQSITDTYGSGTAGANRYSKTFIQGPTNWNADMSLYKVFPITGRYNLRFNMDVFNFLNHQGWNNPNSTDGTEAYWPGGASGATSHNAGRQMQFTLRFAF